MGACGGSKHQKRAARAEAAKAKTDAGDGQPCPLGKCHLRVTVARADTGEGVAAVTVESKGPTAGNKPTVKDSGLADFGVVDPGAYTITVKLSEADKKKYEEPAKPLSLTINKGDTKAQRIEIAPLCKLRVVLIDQEGKGLAAANWDLSKPAKKGKTAADGLIEVDVPWDSEDERSLKVKLPPPPAPAAAAAAPAAAKPAIPPYPPAHDLAQFEDEAPKAIEPVTEIDWKLSVADLEEGDNDDGVKARLNNLGFDVADDEKTKRAVKSYQKVYLKQNSPSGVLKDILNDIKTRHDKRP